MTATFTTWRVTASDSGGLEYLTITKDEGENTYTVTRHPNGGGGGDTTQALWSEMTQRPGGAAFLTTRFVFGVQKARVAEKRWAPPSAESITFECDVSTADAYSLSSNFPRD